ncbi:GMC family oxidoreductase [Paracoccus tegillarcae]|uniref:GMC family oxidoreductase n=1 Tax=Paracoccus tegillarcae TaxID=1529068 RepID=UPI0030CC3732
MSRRLAEAGLSVLMLEKGPDLDGQPHVSSDVELADPHDRLSAGRWPLPVRAVVDGRAMELDNIMSACVGGTSRAYAATLERPEPHDLDDSQERPHPTHGWPVGYSEMQPYFDIAERNFLISGETDPLSTIAAPMLRSPRAPTAIDQALATSFRAGGLHPYQTHIAAEFREDCLQCFGYPCPRNCKMDGRSAGVAPALATGRAELLDRCDVTRIEAGQQVQRVHCRRDGHDFSLSARFYILAAGGAASPLLMLRSTSVDWPDGLGNAHDLVGRHLMFHLSELIAIWPNDGVRSTGPSRAISLRDLYFQDGNRFGLIQSMGVDSDYGLILHALRQRFDASRLRRAKPMRPLLRLAPWWVMRGLGPAKVFVGVMEDLPYADNRIIADPADPDRIGIRYSFNEELLGRRAAFRKAMKKAFSKHRTMFLYQAPVLNFAHPCGTLRFGTDPRTSVLNPDCRVHGIDNLYVTDSSFMPTSNGSNPSLTIAANAYRVADLVHKRATETG